HGSSSPAAPSPPQAMCAPHHTRRYCVAVNMVSGFNKIANVAMSLISSKMTFYYKRISPVIWFGFLLFVLVSGLFSESVDRQTPVITFLMGAMVMAILGYLILKRRVFGFADEVLDAGDALIVRSGGQEERISLSDIKNVSYSPYMTPPRVTLSLRRQTV